MSTPKAFFAAVASIALAIEEMTKTTQNGMRTGGMFPETLMVQFAEETGFHEEGVWQGNEGWKGKYNLAGISPSGGIADYTSYKEFEDAYVSTIKQDAYGFPAVLLAPNPETQMLRLGRSEWAIPYHYDRQGKGGRPGIDLTSLYQDYSREIADALNSARAALANKPAQEVAEPVLKEGDKGPEVEKVQQELDQHGEHVATDGDFGPATQQAVVDFQRKDGLTPDGIVGQQTEAALADTPKNPETAQASTATPAPEVAAELAKDEVKPGKTVKQIVVDYTDGTSAVVYSA